MQFKINDNICDFLKKNRQLSIYVAFQNLAVKERNEAVEAARLSTWWHFVCSLGPKVQELFDQV